MAASPWLRLPLQLQRLLRAISLPRMREQPARTTLTVLGVALGVAVLIAVKIVSDSVMHGVSATIDGVAGKADLQLSASSSSFEDELLERIRAVPGVYKAAPVLQQGTTILHPAARGERLLMLGVDLVGTDDGFFRDYAASDLTEIRKDLLQFLNSTNNLLVSRAIADRLNLKLHDKVALSTAHGAQDFEVWGFIDGDGLGRAFGGSLAIMYFPSMQEAFARGRNVDHIDLAVTPGADVNVVAERLRNVLGDGYQIERPARRGERVTNMLAAVRSALSLASVIAVLAGGMLVFNTMAISLLQRKRELGTLRALGMTRRQLVTLLTLEGMLLGSAGAASGMLLGVGLSRALLEIAGRALSKVYVQQAITDVHVRWEVLAFGFANGVITTTLASMLPALKASKCKVIEVLQSDASTTPLPARGLGALDVAAACLIIGACFAMQIPPRDRQPIGAIIACFLLLLAGRALLPRVIQGLHKLVGLIAGPLIGVHGRLANDNLPRNLGRTAATTTALMAGAALTLGFATFGVGFVKSLKTWSAQSVPGDLYVTSGAPLSGMASRNVPMAHTLGDEIAQVPGVEAVQYLRIADYDYQGFPVKLMSFKVADLYERYGTHEYLEGRQSDALQLQQGKAMVSENFSHRFNVHQGDTLRLTGQRGVTEFEVAAVIVDYSSDIGTIMLDRDTYIEHWADDRVDTFQVQLAHGVDIAAVRGDIERRFSAQYDLYVLTNAEFRSEILGAADSIFTIMRVLELALLVVASLGIVNSLVASVLDRVREIGVLRSLGMLREHIGRMILIEATLMGLVGVVGGALTGIGLGYVIVNNITSLHTGWYFAYQVPWEPMLVVAAVSLPVSALAGFYPARQAARLSVRDALDYE